jgi:DNA repair exonuclease SbcCD nuclease subunit
MGHKILFVSDIHFGVKSNSESFLKVTENLFLVTLKRIITDKGITDVRILGDLFDNRNTVNVRTFNSVMKVFRWYQRHMPSVRWKVLLGNHDIYYHNRLDISSIDMLRELPNVQIIEEITEEKINNKSIITFPWLIKDSTNWMKFKEISKGTKKYDLCLGHFEINGFEVQHGITHDGGNDTGEFKNFKRVFTGHFHIRATKNNITYLGSPYQITWGDYGDEKGIYVYDVDTDSVEYTPNTDAPIFVKINIKDLTNKDIAKLRLVKDNYVKLVIDEKYSDQLVVKAIAKMESFCPIKLEVENNFIEEFDGENSQVEIDFTKMNDPLAFLDEYIKNLENFDNNIDKNEFGEFVRNQYSSVITK